MSPQIHILLEIIHKNRKFHWEGTSGNQTFDWRQFGGNVVGTEGMQLPRALRHSFAHTAHCIRTSDNHSTKDSFEHLLCTFNY
jgi:hypothetical protein